MKLSKSQATITRRRFVATASVMAGSAFWSSLPASAWQATPAASPVPAGRDWQGEAWVGSWSAAPHKASPGFEEFLPNQILELDDQTVRQIVRVSTGGDAVRVRLSNLFGEEPLVIGAAHVALRADGEAIDPASDRALTFSGQASISIPPGALVLSDPVDLTVPPLAELAVSLYFPEPTITNTVHGFAFQTNYLAGAGAGDLTAEVSLPVDSTIQSWVFLTGVDVAVGQPTNVVVALGDSITDGAFSTPDTNQRWPDLLANRLAETAAEGSVAVLNQGIGGNRLLSTGEGDFVFVGPGALSRFDRDVLAQAGRTHVIVYLGINDIIASAMGGEGAPNPTADDLIAALRQIAERGHEAGLVVLGATITPYEGPMFSIPDGEARRQAVNEWVRGEAPSMRWSISTPWCAIPTTPLVSCRPTTPAMAFIRTTPASPRWPRASIWGSCAANAPRMSISGDAKRHLSAPMFLVVQVSPDTEETCSEPVALGRSGIAGSGLSGQWHHEADDAG